MIQETGNAKNVAVKDVLSMPAMQPEMTMMVIAI
jgi:hypothetical protein